MTAEKILAELRAQLAELQDKRDQIDLDALAQERDQYKTAAEAYAPPRTHVVDEQERRLLIAAGAAENAFNAAKDRASRLEDQMRPLQAMLSGPERVQLAQLDADQTAAQLEVAAAVVASAESTVANLAGLLTEAAANHDEDVANAARAVLDAAKAGRVPKPASVDRSRLDALEVAHVLALDERAEAQTAHAAAEKERTDALAQLRSAQRDAARLDLEVAMRTAAPVIARYRNFSGRDDWVDILRRHVYVAEQAEVAA